MLPRSLPKWNLFLNHLSSSETSAKVFHRKDPLIQQERTLKHPEAPMKGLSQKIESLLSKKVTVMNFPIDLGISLLKPVNVFLPTLLAGNLSLTDMNYLLIASLNLFIT